MVTKIFFYLVLFFTLLTSNTMEAQKYDILIKSGHVIDPKNGIDQIMDVAIKNGVIARLSKNLDSNDAGQVVDASGLYVTPGLIDIHTHLFWGTNMYNEFMDGPSGVMPDIFSFSNGVTTVVDAGSSGWRTFGKFKEQTIDASLTRVLAFLNIVGEGMRGGGPYEQNIKDMEVEKTAKFAKENPEYIVGIKLAHYNGHDWTPVKRAEAAAKEANIPLMVDFGGATPNLSLDTLLSQIFRPGDILTHCYQESRSREIIVDTTTRKVKNFVIEAKKRGVVFDVGYGNVSFSFSQAIPAIKQGFIPNSISTDLHKRSFMGTMQNILSVMSRFLSMGMDMKDVIECTTWNPAKEINRRDLGSLSEGGLADIAILRMRKDRDFGFYDPTGYRITGDKKLECVMTIKDGKFMYDLDGIAQPLKVHIFYPNRR